MLLSLGAAKITTLEYGSIVSTHPQIDTIVPAEFAKRIRLKQVEMFDFAASYSSLEHSGLGRYGDELNPYGDVVAVARIGCVLKQNGAFFLGLPNLQMHTENEEAVW